MRKKTQKEVWSTGLTFSNNGQRREEKLNEQLESYEVPELNEALDNFALYVINKTNSTCIFKVFQIALVASRPGQFCENFENMCEINP